MGNKRVLLVVLDGFGYTKRKIGNAILAAKTPTFDYLYKNFPYTFLKASGKDVGLPGGQDGNSEVGHLHMGAGRIIRQDLLRINESIKDGSFFKNKILKKIFERKKRNN